MAKGDTFLSLDSQRAGPVKGESTDSTHAGQIDVYDWSWGMSSSTALGGGGASAKTALSELRIVKRVDNASTALMAVMRTNDPVKKAVLTVRKMGGTPFDFFKLTIERGRITSYDVGSQAQAGTELLERFSISFEKIEVEYHAQGMDGAAKPASSTFNADIR